MPDPAADPGAALTFLDGGILAAAARDTVQRRLAEGRTTHTALEIAEEAADWADATLRALQEQRSPHRPVACGKGCAWCCYRRVPVGAPEVLRLAHALRQTLPPEALEAVRRRLARLDDRTRGLGARQRLAVGLPCALLVDQACSVYDVRPLACRGWNSVDAGACRESVEHALEPTAIPLYAGEVATTDALREGVNAALAEGALQGDQLELTAALRIALEMPDAAARWLAGEPVFAPAAIST